MDNFKVGAQVQLRSGGPLMTVESVQPDGNIRCIWFDRSSDGRYEVKSYAFNSSTLIEA